MTMAALPMSPRCPNCQRCAVLTSFQTMSLMRMWFCCLRCRAALLLPAVAVALLSVALRNVAAALPVATSRP